MCRCPMRRVTGTDTTVLTFDPVELDDTGTYHVAYDDSTKAPAQTAPFFFEVVPKVPLQGALWLALVMGICAIRRLR